MIYVHIIVNENALHSIAIFPIPNAVSFPTAVVPLHVFEPRYRKMINDCVENNMRIGVCHVEKLLRKVEQKETLEEALSSNQSTYQPQSVFSAGFCEIKETLNDGRILVEIEMDGRYLLKKREQEVPYQIYQCESYEDSETDSAMAEEHKQKLNMFLKKLALKQEDQGLLSLLEAPEWQEMDTIRYSFKIFELLRFDGEISQEILELKGADKRLDFACQLLNLNN